MPRISFDVFNSITSSVAQAELAKRNGDEERSDGLLGGVQKLIEKHGLEGSVGIYEMPHNSSTVLRLRGPKGYGISYVIGPKGVEFA